MNQTGVSEPGGPHGYDGTSQQGLDPGGPFQDITRMSFQMLFALVTTNCSFHVSTSIVASFGHKYYVYDLNNVVASGHNEL